MTPKLQVVVVTALASESVCKRSDEYDDEEEGNPKKKAHVDVEEVLDLLEGRWLQN